MDFSKLRKDYQQQELHFDDLVDNPLILLERWLLEAIRANVLEPTAMALSTISSTGFPSCRMMLLKQLDEQGLIFYTSNESPKAKELELKKEASLLFWWKELERQVRIVGKIERIPSSIAAKYFSQRPRGNQLGAWVSHQSRSIPSEIVLTEELKRVEQQFKESNIPPPPWWGGYKLIPLSFEFWQGRPNRLHDRFQYTLESNRWNIERLSP